METVTVLASWGKRKRARAGLNVDIIGRDHLDSDSTRQREFVEDALHRHPAK